MTNPVFERRSSAWSHGVLLYMSLTLLLTSCQLYESLISHNAQAIARATFQFLTSLTLYPAWRSSRSYRTVEYGAGLLRPAVVHAFSIALALLVDAFLRSLTALTVLSYAGSRGMFAFSANPVLARTVLALSTAAVFHAAPHPPGLSAAWLGKILVKRQMQTEPRRTLEERACTSTIALHAVFLHAVCGLLTCIVDLLLLSPNIHVLLAAGLEIATAACATMLVWPLVRITTRILMHATPPKLVSAISSAVRSVTMKEAVVDCHNVHVWEEAPGVYVGTVSVRVRERASPDSVMQTVVQAFDGIVDDLTVQVETCRDPVRVGGFEGAGGTRSD